MQLSHKVAEEAYKTGCRRTGANRGPAESLKQQKKPDEDVVDADFEEVKK